MTAKRKILVTNGLTYANDSIHIGHMLGYIQADIWTRFLKLQGHECYYICGSDCHGTPIMLRAEKENISPETLVENIKQEQDQDCRDFLINYDNFYTTHSTENQDLTNLIYQHLQENGDITKKIIEQAYDAEKEMFLPDRFVKGTCPKCGAPDQYGDSCEACGATYAPTELKDPVSVLSGTTPVTKTSEHYFFQLPHYEAALREWTKAGHLQEQVVNKLDEWFNQGLQNWDISRDAPYFGFEIPNAPGKYFYVWLEAPIGYFASFKNFCDQHKNINFEEFILKDSTTELYHILGKDIMYFHALFWPALLMGAKLRTPTALFVHGFITINGEKMSKSRGTFIKARAYLNHLDPEYLRYYFASKLSSRIEDIDLNLEDFRLKVNADLVGKVVNIASRCASFIHKKFDSQLSATCSEPALLQTFIDAGEDIAKDYEKREFSKAVKTIMALADRANQYIDEKKPWLMAKDPDLQTETHQVCTMGLNLFRLLVLYLKPILPNLAENSEGFLNIESQNWETRKTPLLSHTINPFKPLMQRIDPENIEKMLKDK